MDRQRAIDLVRTIDFILLNAVDGVIYDIAGVDGFSRNDLSILRAYTTVSMNGYRDELCEPKPHLKEVLLKFDLH